MADNTKTNENLIGCMAALLIMPFLIGLRGWVIATLWRWLIAPTFNQRVLTVWQAIGLSIVLEMFTMKAPQHDDESVLETTIKTTIFAILYYATSLGLGWIVAHQI